MRKNVNLRTTNFGIRNSFLSKVINRRIHNIGNKNTIYFKQFNPDLQFEFHQPNFLGKNRTESSFTSQTFSKNDNNSFIQTPNVNIQRKKQSITKPFLQSNKLISRKIGISDTFIQHQSPLQISSRTNETINRLAEDNVFSEDENEDLNLKLMRKTNQGINRLAEDNVFSEDENEDLNLKLMRKENQKFADLPPMESSDIVHKTVNSPTYSSESNLVHLKQNQITMKKSDTRKNILPSSFSSENSYLTTPIFRKNDPEKISNKENLSFNPVYLSPATRNTLDFSNSEQSFSKQNIISREVEESNKSLNNTPNSFPINIREIAEQVYQLLSFKLKIDKERAGEI